MQVSIHVEGDKKAKILLARHFTTLILHFALPHNKLQ